METQGKPITDLVKVDFDVVDITDEEVIKNGLADLKKRFTDIADPTTSDGYESNRAGVEIMRTLRGKVTAKIKEKKAPVLKKQKQLIAIEKWILGDVLSLEDPMKNRNKEHDAIIAKEKLEKIKADEERVDTILAKIEEIKLSPFVNMDKPSNELQYILDGIKAGSETVGDWAMERAETAQDTIAATTERLEMLIAAKQAQEETDRLQKEAAAKLEADKAAKEKEEAKERKAEEARLAAQKTEQDLVAADLKKQQDDIDAAKQKIVDDEAAIQKEKDDIKVAAQKVIDDKKEADEKIAKKIEDDRLAAIKKEADDKIAAENLAKSLKAEAEEKQRKEEEDEKKAILDSENYSKRVGDVRSFVETILSNDDDIESIVESIVNGHIPHTTFT